MRVQYRIKTFKSGRRERQTIVGGRVVDTKPLPRAKLTKTRKKLIRRRRRIGR